MLTAFFMFLMVATGLLLIMVVLIQRGKGGGLVGALGGMGGSSALGTKASDALTWVTMVVASVWILSCIVTLKLVAQDTGPIGPIPRDGTLSVPTEREAGATGETTEP